MLNPPEVDDTSLLADWAELCLLFGNERSISKSEFISALEEDLKEDPEDIVTAIWQELSWRKLTAPTGYPIEISESNIDRKRSWRRSICYSFLLLLSAQSFISEIKIEQAEWTSTSKLFERLTALALKAYVGETIIMGSPRGGKVPANFQEAVAYLCDKVAEEKHPNPCSTERTKDDGLDVIAWRPLDARSGKLVVLAQCAAGADWKDKTRELCVDIWNNYVNWSPLIPVPALAFPHINNREWRRLSLEGGLLFDRLRLSSLGEPSLDCRLGRKLKEWIENKIADLPTMP